MKKYEEFAKFVIKNVGDKENIIGVTHCVTRLRFQLKNDSLASEDQLKKNDGVITVMKSAGQFQVVVGNHVSEVFDEVKELIGLSDNSDIVVKKLSFKEKFIDLITSIFMPSISVLCACGMIKGLNTILAFAGVYSDAAGIYTLIDAIGDSFFYFFPIVIGYNAAKKFRLNPYIGLIIGAALCYPSINGVDVMIFGFNMNVTYTATVLPVILTVALAAPMERLCNKVIPDVVKSFLTPMVVILISTIVGFMMIGPVANYVSDSLSNLLLSLYGVSPLLAGFVFASLWQVMVVFGVHMTFVILAIMNIVSGGTDPILSLAVFVAFAQSAVVLAIMFKTKDKKLKSICIPSFVSAIFGVTEPAIYGITLPRMKMFIISCLGAGLSGAYAGYVGLKYYTMAGLGIFEIPALFPSEGMSDVLVHCLIATAIAVFTSFVLAFIFYKDDELTTDSKVIESNETVYSPIKGDIITLAEVQDDAFSKEVLGKGIAIIPSEGKVYSPFDGTIVTLFPTKHAIGVVSDRGCEVLIHVGMNTVQLGGKYFESHVNQGDKVVKGQLLVEFDLENLLSEGYNLETPVIVTNTKDYTSIDANVIDENVAIIVTA